MNMDLSKGLCGGLLPTAIAVEQRARHRARFTLEAFERGVGTTLGASLRRVLLTQVETGRGSVPGTLRRHPGGRLAGGATIDLGASFSPVRSVSWAVEPVRRQQRIDLDRLMVDIETDGSIAPDEALAQAARLLQAQAGALLAARHDASMGPAGGDPPDMPLAYVLAGLTRPVEDLGLSVRSTMGLKAACIHRIGDVVQRTENDLLRAPSLGRRNIGEIKDALTARGLALGTNLPGWQWPSGGARASWPGAAPWP